MIEQKHPPDCQDCLRWRKASEEMIKSIDGMIARNGMLVRRGIARKSTLLKAIRKIPDAKLDEYMVIYTDGGQPVRQSAREFLTAICSG